MTKRGFCVMTESEWQTRKRRIDARLRSMNPSWQIVRYRDGLDFAALHCHAVEELPTATGPADYGLFAGGKLLGIIEAKKVTVNPQNVLEQAKRYCEGALQGPGNWNGFKVPFLYATNGEIYLASGRPTGEACFPPDQQFPHRTGAGSAFRFQSKTSARLAARHATRNHHSPARLPAPLH